MWYEYVASWFTNFIIIAVIVAIVDATSDKNIEDHPCLGVFFLFILPTVLEIASWYFYHRAFMFSVF